MNKNEELIQGIQEFIDRPANQKLADRIKKFAATASLKFGDSEEKVLPKPKAEEEGEKKGKSEGGEAWNPISAFFAPVGYKPLFEQEVLFLVDEGLPYESVMKMPVPFRKKLIDRKIKTRQDMEKASSESRKRIKGLPPGFGEQLFKESDQGNPEASDPE